MQGRNNSNTVIMIVTFMLAPLTWLSFYNMKNNSYKEGRGGELTNFQSALIYTTTLTISITLMRHTIQNFRTAYNDFRNNDATDQIATILPNPAETNTEVNAASTDAISSNTEPHKYIQ